MSAKKRFIFGSELCHLLRPTLHLKLKRLIKIYNCFFSVVTYVCVYNINFFVYNINLGFEDLEKRKIDLCRLFRSIIVPNIVTAIVPFNCFLHSTDY